MIQTLLACFADRPAPVVPVSVRWEAVLALAETECDEWPEDQFPTDVGPAERRAALRAWHAADPSAVVDVDARYVTFAFVDRTEAEDVPVIAHLVSSLRRCGRWVDQRTEEELLARACGASPAATRDLSAAFPPAPSPKVYAAREAVWVVDMEAPDVSGRFTAALVMGTQEWMAKWVLDGEGVLPEMPPNMPFAQLLREETRAPEPGVREMVARCTSAAPAGSFRVPRPGAAGVWLPDPAGMRLWWPDEELLGAEGPLGPMEVWDGAERKGVVDVGPVTRVEHCRGRFHHEAVVALGEGGATTPRIALPPGTVANDWRLEPDACGDVLVGPEGSSSLGCCPTR